jgi:ATP-binding cassette subfamily B multidrug efflux pump
MLKLFKYLKPYWIPISATVILVFFQSLTSLYLPTLMSDIVNTGLMQGDTDTILRLGGQMLLVAGAGIVAAMIAGLLASRAAMAFGRDIRARVFSHVESFSLHEFDGIGTPSLITRSTNDITQVQMAALMILRMFIMAPTMAIGGIIMAVSKDAGLSWILAVLVPVIGVIVGVVLSRALPLFRSMQKKIDKINQVVREGLTGIRVIRAFDRDEEEKKRFDLANMDLTKTAITVNKLMAIVFPLMPLLMSITSIAILWFGAHKVDAGETNIGNLMAFMQYAMQIMFSLVMVSIMFVMLPRASASAARINEVFGILPTIKDPEGVKKTDGLKGYLEFKNVTFSYPGAGEPAIENISFKATPGEVIAIIGGTGAGKSTMVNLIPRFYDPYSGAILVDGMDIREISLEDLRSRIGFVPQKAVLFNGTVADNIRFGKEDAPDEEIARAAEIAQAADFIKEMKDGYQSEIAQGGTNVSGGQKQRLAIARALARRPEIYVFDDTFSAVDFKTDARLRAALSRETAAATVIIVAQRVNTVMDADRIIVLDEGKIVGTGTHKELLATCGVYREIVSSQLPEEALA